MKLGQTKISRHYNKLVFVFLILTLVIVLFVGYFAFSKTEIVVQAKTQETLANFEATLADSGGILLNTEVSGTQEYTNLKDTKEVEDYAAGQVIIYNNYTADQQLVATTRLLSSTGVLFRTTEDVVAPKGGSVEVGIKADEPGLSGNVGAGKFEIVALWPGKKDKIYAESSQPMTGGIRKITAVSEDDINAAEKAALQELKKQASAELNKQLATAANSGLTLGADSLSTEILESTTDAKAGDEVDKITVQMKIKAIGVAVDLEKLKTLADQEVQKTLSSDLTLIAGGQEEITYSLLEYNLEKETANLQVNYTGQAIVSSGASIFDKEKIMGLKETELISYLEDFPEVESVSVKFSPFWVTAVPHLESNIKITVE